jgi:spermidine synthase
VVSNDGRNFLRTTRETFDVITADPIHPWSGGAAYLYTAEYFRVAADRLAPGGVICQWLPIYELSVEDVRSVVRTFGESFRHIALWLTHYDAELVGSNAPLVFDEDRLAARFAHPAVADDLAAVEMGSARDFLSYFLAGDAGLRAFARDGIVNTDDNLRLEFSAPRSQGVEDATARLVSALAAYREPLLGYLEPAADAGASAERRAFWDRVSHLAPRYDRAHALALANRFDAEFASLLEGLRADQPDFAPLRFLERHSRLMQAQEPRRIAAERFDVLDAQGRPSVLEVSAVVMRVGEARGAVVFVDNERRAIYGQRYVDAPEAQLDARFAELSAAVLATLRAEYEAEARAALERGGRLPERAALAARLEARVAQLTSP